MSDVAGGGGEYLEPIEDEIETQVQPLGELIDPATIYSDEPPDPNSPISKWIAGLHAFDRETRPNTLFPPRFHFGPTRIVNGTAARLNQPLSPDLADQLAEGFAEEDEAEARAHADENGVYLT